MSHLITERGTPAAPPPSPHSDGGRGRLVEVVVPVHNEERVLAASVERLHGYLAGTFPYPFRITIADNASTDATWRAAQELAARLPRVRAVRLEEKGAAARCGTCGAPATPTSSPTWTSTCPPTWTRSCRWSPPHLRAQRPGHRVPPHPRVRRRPRAPPQVISRCYNLLLRTALAARFTDAQCGFKAARTEIVQALLRRCRTRSGSSTPSCCCSPNAAGCASTRSPSTGSTTPTPASTCCAPPRPTCAAWPASPAASAPARSAPPSGAAPRPPSRPGWAASCPPSRSSASSAPRAARPVRPAAPGQGPLWANALSLAATTIGNTAANRRFTFGVTGTRRALRHQLEGGAAFLLGLALSTGGLALLHAAAPGASRTVEVAALVTANAAATLVRFLPRRAWIFHPRRLGRGAPGRVPAAGENTGGTRS